MIDQFDRILGKDQIAVFISMTAKNGRGAGKDRHENIGFGQIGFDTLERHRPPSRILCGDPENSRRHFTWPRAGRDKKKYPPYQYEIAMLRKGNLIRNYLIKSAVDSKAS